jgi:hypothetical protein
MSHRFAVALGLVVILASGLVHGMWTERWYRSAALESAVARLKSLPEEIGPWKGRVEEQDPEALVMAGAAGSWSRRFINSDNGDEILVILLCGRPGLMSVHRPEHCYTGAGYELTTRPSRYSLPLLPAQKAQQRPAECWTALFRKDEVAGPLQLRIFWSWLGPAGWQAADNPRWTFAREQALYKLYVVRVTPGPEPLAADPAVGFLVPLIAELDRHLVP